MQDPATFNLDAIKKKIEEAIRIQQRAIACPLRRGRPARAAGGLPEQATSASTG